jgi:xylose isomerase
LAERYASWDSALGRKIANGECTLEELEQHASASGEPTLKSGREELLRSILNNIRPEG